MSSRDLDIAEDAAGVDNTLNDDLNFAAAEGSASQFSVGDEMDVERSGSDIESRAGEVNTAAIAVCGPGVMGGKPVEEVIGIAREIEDEHRAGFGDVLGHDAGDARDRSFGEASGNEASH